MNPRFQAVRALSMTRRRVFTRINIQAVCQLAVDELSVYFQVFRVLLGSHH
jgi:hypothetical protein